MATNQLTPTETLGKFLTDNSDRIRSSVPIGVRAELITRSLTSMMRMDPKIAGCTHKSLINCLEQMIMTGLPVGKGLTAQAHVVVRNVKNDAGVKEPTACFQINYKGVKELVRRSGEGKLVMREVRECDHFVDKGEDEMPEFRRSDDPNRHKSKLTWVFAAYVPKDGSEPTVKVWSRERCIAHRDQYATGYYRKKTDFWHEEHSGFPVMCMKCPVHELANRGDLPLSADHVRMLDGLQAMREIQVVEPAAITHVEPQSITDQTPLEDEPIPVDWKYVKERLETITAEKPLDDFRNEMVDTHPDERQAIWDRCEEHRDMIRGTAE